MNRFFKIPFWISLLGLITLNECNQKQASISGEFKQWHTLTFSFEGPMTSESDELNPFLNFRLHVTFINGDDRITIPGFYATDGMSEETSSDNGAIWQVRFVPNKIGEWKYTVSFEQGENIAISNDSGKPVYFDGQTGSFTITESDKSGNDFRGKGRLVQEGHYLEYEGTGEVFLKGGVDSPENMLGYVEFDGTYFGGVTDEQREGESITNGNLHRYEPHIKHWKEGDPAWKNGRGKGLIGGLNYLADKGVNSAYMILNNVEGDGKDVFPWTSYNGDFTRFDVSKLAQWEIVFTHMEKLGLMCHFVTQETENELMLNEGNLGLERKLFYREMIARFGHHLAVTWNLGEENGPAPWMGDVGQTDEQRKAMANFVKETNPYKNLVVLHTLPSSGLKEAILSPLLDWEALGGPSLQTQPDEVHEETLKWRRRSALSGNPWVVCSDEIGPHTRGALPDEVDPNHDTIRHHVLWGNLMAGGAGVEWYFGYMYPNTDLTCEDWSSRENLYKQTRIALDFFRSLPIEELEPADELITSGSGYAIQKPGEMVIVYKPTNEVITLQIESGAYRLSWFDPRGGYSETQSLNLTTSTKGVLVLPSPSNNPEKDWVAILELI